MEEEGEEERERAGQGLRVYGEACADEQGEKVPAPTLPRAASICIEPKLSTSELE